jgi:phosphatidylglycerol:prolipoprotein diacylglycerol transferase
MAYPLLSDLIRDLTGTQLPLPVPMFGLLVAAALLTAIWVTESELRRMYAIGRIGPGYRRVKPKGGAITNVPTPPHELVSGLGAVMAFFGVIGARIFHLLEYPSMFKADPWGMIFTRSGFTIYGGLIFGVIAGTIFARRRGIAIAALGDAVAPALMLGYAIGRVGCQVSGDGDWGIPANLSLKPVWLPLWLWAQTYDHNIAGVLIAPPGVYPTPIYETAMALIVFAILWGVRKHPFRAGWLFALFLVMCGVERFLIELIRVNAVITVSRVSATQAEFVSVVLVLAGLTGLILLRERKLGVQRGPSRTS